MVVNISACYKLLLFNLLKIRRNLCQFDRSVTVLKLKKVPEISTLNKQRKIQKNIKIHNRQV